MHEDNALATNYIWCYMLFPSVATNHCIATKIILLAKIWVDPNIQYLGPGRNDWPGWLVDFGHIHLLAAPPYFFNTLFNLWWVLHDILLISSWFSPKHWRLNKFVTNNILKVAMLCMRNIEKIKTKLYRPRIDLGTCQNNKLL